jgi:hypothetical protein
MTKIKKTPVRPEGRPGIRCGSSCTTSHKDRLQCFEKEGHGGNHFAEDAAGRAFIWHDVAPKPGLK